MGSHSMRNKHLLGVNRQRKGGLRGKVQVKAPVRPSQDLNGVRYAVASRFGVFPGTQQNQKLVRQRLLNEGFIHGPQFTTDPIQSAAADRGLSTTLFFRAHESAS